MIVYCCISFVVRAHVRACNHTYTFCFVTTENRTHISCCFPRSFSRFDGPLFHVVVRTYRKNVRTLSLIPRAYIKSNSLIYSRDNCAVMGSRRNKGTTIPAGAFFLGGSTSLYSSSSSRQRKMRQGNTPLIVLPKVAREKMSIFNLIKEEDH